MRICVVGAGAIGGVIAARLAAVPGTEVSVLARGAARSAIADRGLRLSHGGETVTARVPVSAGALLGPDTAVLSTLNGVPWWFLDGFGGPAAGRHLDSVDPGGVIASVFPAPRVIGGTVHLSASAPGPGEVSWHGGNGLIIGELDGADSPRLGALAGALHAAGFDVTTSPRVRDDVWYKLWGNLTLNPVCALTGATAGPVLNDDLVRGFLSAAMLEAPELDALTGMARACGLLRQEGQAALNTKDPGPGGPGSFGETVRRRRGRRRRSASRSA